MKLSYRNSIAQQWVAGAFAFAVSTLAVKAADGVDVLVSTVDGESLSGRLVSFSLERGLTLEDFATGRTDSIPAGNVVRLTTDVTVEEEHNRSAYFKLVNGDLIMARPVSFDDDLITVEGTYVGRVRMPFESVAAYVTRIGSSSVQEAAVRTFLAVVSSRDDRVLLANGDVVSGVVIKMDADGVAIDTNVGALTLPFDRVAVVHVVNDPPRLSSDMTARVLLRDGSRFRVSEVRWKDDPIRAQLSADQSIELDAGRIVRVDIEGGRWRPLSEFEPISVEQTPMISYHWPMVRNRNVLGKPLRVAGKQYDNGLGVHSRSALTFDLQGDYESFTTYYGMDDDSGPFANVHVAIRVDGENRHERRDVREGTLFGPVLLDVRQAARIELVVDFGKHGGVQDRFNWIDPALIRPAE